MTSPYCPAPRPHSAAGVPTESRPLVQARYPPPKSLQASMDLDEAGAVGRGIAGNLPPTGGQDTVPVASCSPNLEYARRMPRWPTSCYAIATAATNRRERAQRNLRTRPSARVACGQPYRSFEELRDPTESGAPVGSLQVTWFLLPDYPSCRALSTVAFTVAMASLVLWSPRKTFSSSRLIESIHTAASRP